MVYSQGRAILTPVAEIPTVDLKAVQAECNQRILSADEVYEAFKTMGIQYGPGHQGIEQIYVGQGQVLAKLSLPSSVAATRGTICPASEYDGCGVTGIDRIEDGN